MRAVLLLSVFLSSAELLCQDGDPTANPVYPKSEIPEGYRFEEVRVKKHPEHTVELWIYSPERKGSYPCVLDIHGGGWQKRQITSDRPFMERMAKKGFVTALVSYRVSGEAIYPAQLHDCKAAIRVLRARAKEWQIDPERMLLEALRVGIWLPWWA